MIPASVLSIDATKSKIFSICEIRPYLFIAGYGALSHQKIKDLGITHAIDVTNNSNNQRFIGVKYFDVKIDDNEKADIKKHFIEASAFIQKAKESVSE
uniref:Dual specificity phosphatase catalytic domain-containing protein n=1 Tax=Panagrolaimus sp. ES5 TaxID=591445 RepID=A0AC34GXX5_9BILA